MYWNNSIMSTAEFESIIILSMEKPSNSTLSGVVITAIVQFGGLNLNQESYKQEWNIISNNSQFLGDWIIDDSEISSKNLFVFPSSKKNYDFRGIRKIRRLYVTIRYVIVLFLF